MFGVLVLSQGGLAAELVAAAEMVAGRSIPVEALGLDWRMAPEQAQLVLEERLREMNRGEGVLILTPVFGDTPTNLAVALSDPGRHEVVAGVNLPMLLRIGCQNLTDVSVTEAARLLEEKGRLAVGRATSPAHGVTPTGSFRHGSGNGPCE